MLAGILRFEWRYHTRRLTFAAAAAALALAAAMLVGTGYGPPGVAVNAPYVVMQSLGLLSLAGVFVLTIFCADAALRDVEHGMMELIFSRPVGKPRYLFGRFAGALLAGVTVMSIAALVLMVAPLVMHVEPGRLGPVRPLAYLWALAVLVVPNLALAGALLFAVATLTRSTLATYVGGVAIWALYFVGALLVDSPLMAGVAPPTPESLARAALLDPFGLSAFFEQTRYWTPAERGVRLTALAGHMLMNRLIWSGVAAAVLAMVYARFSFSVVGARRSRTWIPAFAGMTTRAGMTNREGSQGAASDVSLHVTPAKAGVHVYRPTPQAVRGVFWPALRSSARSELRHVLRGWTFLALLAMWAFVAGMEAVAQLGGGEYGTRVLPTTGILFDAVQLPLLLLGTITVVYYAAEVAWRERVVRIDPLVDATPAASAALYLAKAAALAAVPLVMGILAVVVGIAVQLANGYTRLEPALWLSLLWFAGAPLVLLAIGALAVQALTPNRWLGMLGGLALALLARRGEAIGLEHPMLRFGAVPAVAHSDMDSFGPVASSFAAFVVYWGAAAALLACVSWGAWRRGVDPGVRARVAALPCALGRGGGRLTLACAALFAVAGVTLFVQTNVAHAWERGATRAAWRADYERTYRRLAGRAQPAIVAVRTTVDLHPAARRADIAGVYVLENRTAESIDTVWVALPSDVERATTSVAGARLVGRDTRFGVDVFHLSRPLAPGARTELRFSLSIDRGGVRADGFETDVASNGTLLTSTGVWPALGYRPGRELAAPAARREQGLTAAPSAPAALSAVDSVRAAARAAGHDPAWITLDATVSTDPDQTALAPGRLVRTWQAGGRRWFHYITDAPVTPLFGVVSARYAVSRTRQGGVDVEVWHHPAHAANVPRILAAAARSLDLLGTRYGAYPHDALRVVEVPSWSSFGGYALPGVILFTEDRGFLADPRDGDVDLVTRRVAHEVSHQWWGHVVSPAQMAGSATIVETLAKHSEQIVVAAVHGEDALPAMLAFDEDRYLAGRAQAVGAEPTVLEATDEAWLYYGKGAVVMHAVRDLLGGAPVDRALARLIAAHGGPRGAATSLDLRDALLAETRTAPDSALVGEWLGGRAVYELRVETATARPLGGGRWRVAARISAAKSSADTTRPVDGEPLGVAVYDDDPGSGHVLWSGRPRVVAGLITLDVEVVGRPAFVVVDPFVTRIDRDRTDDRKRVVVPNE